MDQVARRARLSRALVYVYFRDKSDLHLALVGRALDSLRHRFEAARAGKASGFEEVEAIGWAYQAFARELPHYVDACARFEARTGSDGVQPNEAACMAAGHRVHETMVASFSSLDMFDWVIIGGASKSTQTPEYHPPFDDIVHLHLQARASGCKIYHKTNLFERLREYPVHSEKRGVHAY